MRVKKRPFLTVGSASPALQAKMVTSEDRQADVLVPQAPGRGQNAGVDGAQGVNRVGDVGSRARADDWMGSLEAKKEPGVGNGDAGLDGIGGDEEVQDSELDESEGRKKARTATDRRDRRAKRIRNTSPGERGRPKAVLPEGGTLCLDMKSIRQEFVLAGRLNIQTFMENGRTKYQCPQCNDSFLSKGGAEGHVINHHYDVRPYQCDHCKKAFKNLFALRNHLRIHSGEKPFECEFCGKKFTEKSNLEVHIRGVHYLEDARGDRRFPCEFCDRKFSTKANLLEHMSTHPGGPPRVKSFPSSYLCSICGVWIRHRASYTRHVREHEGRSNGTLFTVFCARCGKGFSRQWNLDRHLVESKSCQAMSHSTPDP